MTSILAIFLTTFTFLTVGYPYSKLLNSPTIVGRLSLAFILGSGLATFIWFLLYLVGLPLTLASFMFGALIAFVAGHLTVRNQPTNTTSSLHSLTKLEKLIIFGIILLFTLALIIAWYHPITSWDSLTLYDFRARVISQSHSLLDLEQSTYHLSYPMMTSLMHAVTYLMGGITPQPLYTLLYLALTGVIYDYLRRLTTRTHALTASLLTMSNPFLFEHATITYSNLPYTTFLTAGLLTATSSPILAGLLLGFSTWVRQTEPFWLVGVILIIIFNYKKRLQTLIAVSLALLIRYAWQVYHAASYLRSGFNDALADSIYHWGIFSLIRDNLGSISSYLTQFIITPYLGIWLLTLTAIFVSRRHRSLLAILASIILILMMVVLGTSVFSTYYSSWYSIGGSATRMVIIFVPLGIIAGVHAHYLLREHHD